MPKAKKLFLLHESRETWRLRLSSPAPRGTCTKCGEIVDWLPAVVAALAFGMTEREVFRQAEEGSIHFAESASGTMLVCVCSLESADDRRPEILTRDRSKGSGSQ